MKFILAFSIALLGFYINSSLASDSRLIESKINSVKTETVQLPQKLLAQFNNELARLKSKAESQKTPKQIERMMRFYWQYKNAFDAMPVQSKIDVLNIFATGDDQGSKLKGYKLIDKAVEYIVLLDGGFTEGNVNKLRKYHAFLVKFNPTVDSFLNSIVNMRVEEIRKERAEIRKEIAEIRKERAEIRKKKAESAARLEKLIALRKQMEVLVK